jgi:hypothetical protein
VFTAAPRSVSPTPSIIDTGASQLHYQHTPSPLLLKVRHPTDRLSSLELGAVTVSPTSYISSHQPRATMSSGQVLKADKDFTKEVDKALPEAEKLGSVRSASLRSCHS